MLLSEFCKQCFYKSFVSNDLIRSGRFKNSPQTFYIHFLMSEMPRGRCFRFAATNMYAERNNLNVVNDGFGLEISTQRCYK
jgi:hypothetical protein